ncbi:MAG: glycine zipper 2TM domain-containing protein [Deltaproteobacteria bacterium]|nr:glycine zipper 2TM domain-containing protein [Deltaproteobacteria bacterium]
MRKLRTRTILAAVAVVLFSLLLAACQPVQGPSPEAYKAGAVGAGVGAAAGALLDEDNRWRGGVIGAGLGALMGGAVGEISSRAAREAAQQQQPVYYTNGTGTRSVYAQPIGRQGNCHIVKEKYYEHGQLVKETEREVCE